MENPRPLLQAGTTRSVTATRLHVGMDAATRQSRGTSLKRELHASVASPEPFPHS